MTIPLTLCTTWTVFFALALDFNDSPRCILTAFPTLKHGGGRQFLDQSLIIGGPEQPKANYASRCNLGFKRKWSLMDRALPYLS